MRGHRKYFALKLRMLTRILTVCDLKEHILDQLGHKTLESDLKVIYMGKELTRGDMTLAQANIGYDSLV